jgi:dTDP-4-dehydrorhamnose reductase
MRILLLGKNGQVGWELQRSLAPLGSVIACDRHEADLENLPQLRKLILQHKPSVIVNAAAYTNVDKAEAEIEKADAINTVAAAFLAEQAKALDAHLIHYSTDYVFDGNGSASKIENDQTAPLNVYGKTKLAGELAIQHSGCRYMIFRTSWVYATRGNNFAKTILRLAAERDQLQVINDQIGAPTGAELIADVSAHALRQINSTPSDVYHLVASGETSWHGYAEFVINQSEKAGIALKLTADSIKAICSNDYPTAAQRPLNSRLNNAKLQKTLNLKLPEWQNGVARMMAELFERTGKPI